MSSKTQSKQSSATSNTQPKRSPATSNTQSERSSATSSPLPRSPPQSLIVSRVSPAKDESRLFNDLSANYPGVKKVSRTHDQDGNELSSIRVDFESENTVAQILNEDAIYIENRAHYIRPYWPRKCYRCDNEGHVSAECPQYALPEWRLAALIEVQKTHFESLINAFENRWNTRLSQLKAPNKSDMTPLVPTLNDLTTVCQQFNQQNLQMQEQLNTITNRIQNIQTKVNN